MKTIIACAIAGIFLSVSPTEAAGAATDVITASEIFNSPQPDAETWQGLDTSRYPDIPFYGKKLTHVTGRFIPYGPEAGFSTLTITAHNSVSGYKSVKLAEINPDGTFALDIPLSYPQFVDLEAGQKFSSLFLMPGDTMEIIMDPRDLSTPLFPRSEGRPTEAVAVTLLSDSILRHFSLDNLWSKSGIDQSSPDEEQIYKYNRRLAELLDTVCEALPGMIGNLPVSVFVKDMAAAKAIATIAMSMEELEMIYIMANHGHLIADPVEGLMMTEEKNLDQTRLYAPRIARSGLLYNNPLIVCCDDLFTNRWQHNVCYRPESCVAAGTISLHAAELTILNDGETPYDRLMDIIDVNKRQTAIGDGFTGQIVRVNGLISKLNQAAPSRQNLDNITQLLTAVIRLTSCQSLSGELMEAYNTYMRDLTTAENPATTAARNSTTVDALPGEDVLKQIIAPYTGNVLFLDFWGIYCGPCRSGMINMKPILQHYEGEPFKVLYIAEDDSQRAACERWLRNEDIRGEHIFVSPDNWNRLRELFNFTGIPHGVLIDKKGNVIARDYHLYKVDPVINAAIAEE